MSLMKRRARRSSGRQTQRRSLPSGRPPQPFAALPMFQPLESRRLLSTTLDVNGLLTIDGTAGNDDVSVAVAAGQLTVTLNTANDGQFDVTLITSIQVNGLDGNDTLSLAGTSISGVIVGGDGADTLTGGSGNDTLLGGDGDDSIIANDTRADTIDGGNGDDTATVDTGLDTHTNIEFGVPVLAPKLKITVGGNPITNGVDTIDFGTVNQHTSAVKTFTVLNEGTDTLTLGSLTVPTGYTIIDTLVASLDPGGSDTFSIELNTATAGTKSGVVTLANSDATANPFTFTVTGIVISTDPAATVTLARPASPVDNGNSTFEFGNRGKDAKGPTRTFRVRNDGASELTLGDITVPDGFVIIDPLVGPLAPGAMESFTIQMLTTTPGNKDGFVSIVTNDPARNPFTFRIVGTIGVNSAPSPEVTLNALQSGQLRGVVSGSSSFGFGTASVGARRPARTFRVANDGNADLRLSDLVVPTGFVVLDGLPAKLTPGTTDTLVIALDTAVAGSKSGSVSFVTNDANETPFTFGVSGTIATAPQAGAGVTATLSSGTLTVTGTSGIDTISFGLSSKGLSVVANSKTVSGSPFNGVARIVVNAGDGADRVVIGTLNIPSTLSGGNGNDTLYGGNAADALYGNNGDDVLDGGNANDSLFGGLNNDVLTGGAGLDALHGDDGNDTLNASDGLADLLVDGGGGNDVIHKDRTDNATGS